MHRTRQEILCRRLQQREVPLPAETLNQIPPSGRRIRQRARYGDCRGNGLLVRAPYHQGRALCLLGNSLPSRASRRVASQITFRHGSGTISPPRRDSRDTGPAGYAGRFSTELHRPTEPDRKTKHKTVPVRLLVPAYRSLKSQAARHRHAETAIMRAFVAMRSLPPQPRGPRQNRPGITPGTKTAPEETPARFSLAAPCPTAYLRTFRAVMDPAEPALPDGEKAVPPRTVRKRRIRRRGGSQCAAIRGTARRRAGYASPITGPEAPGVWCFEISILPMSLS